MPLVDVTLPYGIGKTSAKDKVENLHEHAQVFMKYLSDREAIEEAGQKSLSILYKIPVGVSLALERATKFSSKVAKRSEYLLPENLPPTEASAKSLSPSAGLARQHHS